MSAIAMKSRCFCPPESVMNQASRLSARPSCSSSRLRQRFSGRAMPRVDCFLDLDALLELRLLELHADPVLQL